MQPTRISSIDTVRGLVMLIMPLDHVRDLLHANSLIQSPTDLTTTTPFLFFVRWITHFCAPVFVFLAGTSAQRYLVKVSLNTAKSYLLKRGLYLICLEFTLVNFLLYFDPGFHIQLSEVIAAIGFGFIFLALMIELSTKTLVCIGLAIVFLHNLLPFIPFEEGSILKAILSPFFSLNVLPLTTDRVFIIAYPPIPWFGIMLLGFAIGKLYDHSATIRLTYIKRLGLLAILLFFVLRIVNIYGDPINWSAQPTPIFTILSFLNVTKYPPSLLFSLMTLGLMLLCLAYTELVNNNFLSFAAVFGRVPLFFFLIHFLIIHLILIIILLYQGFSWSELEFASGNFGRPRGVTSGVSLQYVLIIWLVLLTILYPLCVWFGKLKQQKKIWWVSYL